MSKIICDICGTSYQDTAECCPICGCSRDAVAELLGEEVIAEEIVEETKPKGGKFGSKKKEIFDFDEVNSPPDEEEEEDEEEDYDEEEEEEAPRHNTFVVILLTILIAGLLFAAGFIFVRYFLPNMKAEETVPTTTAAVIQTTEAAEETEPTIPCMTLAMKNPSVAELKMEGGQFLLNVVPSPENTTDKIVYTSADESIATVSEDGKITAVSEGETIVYISCGKHSVECNVVVNYQEETVPPTTESPVTEATIPETTAAAVSNPDVILKLKKNDIMLGVYYQFTLELDCALEQNQVEWSSEHPHIATVDENGVVTAVKSGTTIVSAKYGDQVVECWIRCH